MMNMKRRQFLVTASSVASFFLVQSLPVNAFSPAESEGELPLNIGQFYLQKFGQEPELDDLRRLLGGSADSVFERPDTIEVLRSKIQDDFLSSKTFKWENWILSKTEGRLCALASLEHT